MKKDHHDNIHLSRPLPDDSRLPIAAHDCRRAVARQFVRDRSLRREEGTYHEHAEHVRHDDVPPTPVPAR